MKCWRELASRYDIDVAVDESASALLSEPFSMARE